MNNPDWIRYAEREILQQYGHKVDFAAKSKSLVKFGRTAAASSSAVVTVAEFQDAEVNETYATGNTIDKIVSTSGSDTQVMTIEGHTYAAGNFTFVSQTATLTGQTAVTLTTPLCRATRVFVSSVGTINSPTAPLAGNVAVYDGTVSATLTAGKPDTDAAVKLMVLAGKNQSNKCATSVSSTDYWAITGIAAGIERTSGGTPAVDILVETRKIGGVWCQATGGIIPINLSAQAHTVQKFEPYIIIPPNSDVRMRADASAAATVHGTIYGILGRIT